jgi:NarL family two-component system sensor histidine kinase LiaS
VQHQIRTLEQTASKMMREMRALLLELRPTSLEHLGLHEALAEVAAAYRERLGIAINVEVSPLRLEARIEDALLRITQEALSNAARHARAADIALVLSSSDGTVELRVRDNGQGFDLDDPGLRHGVGLRSLQERVAELRGTVQLASRPGAGTEVTVRIPLEEQA